MHSADDEINHLTSGQMVSHSIRRKIILGEFRDGDYLPTEAQLLKQYAVSRPVLREAIRILQSEALLTIRRGSKGGARVNAPNPRPVARQAGGLLQYGRTTVFDVFRARAIIEPPAVRLLAQSSTPAIVARLRDALDREAEAIGQPRRWGMVHGDFHTLVVELSGSNTLALFAHIMADITAAHVQAVWQQASHDANSLTQAELAHRVHRKLARLVEEGNAVEAEKLWRRHLEETTEQMLVKQGDRELLDLIG